MAGSGRRIHDFSPLVVPAVRARLMRLLHLMTVGALGERRCVQVVMRTPLILASLGMATLGIRHTYSFYTPLSKGHSRCFP